jgi:hypothetical protein
MNYKKIARCFIVSAAAALLLVSCSEEDVTGSANKCATDLYPAYNPKALNQCVEVCVKCSHGTVVTCSTSCTLKGAH